MALKGIPCFFAATLSMRAETRTPVIYVHDYASWNISVAGVGLNKWSIQASPLNHGLASMALEPEMSSGDGNETHANRAPRKLRGSSNSSDSVLSSTKNMDSDVNEGLADIIASNGTINITEDVKYLGTCSAACNWCFKNFRTHCFAKCYRGCFRHCNQYDCTSRSVWYASPALQPKVNNPGYFICQSSNGRKRCPT